ncbi:MAG TPA: VOC family protein, partial [Solirubrobacteraceae bacterium]
MHGQLEAPGDLVLMGADTPRSMELAEGSSITISLSGADEAELRGYWDKLSDGATIVMALEKQMWGDVFGQLTDRFGISWLVNIAQPR